MKQEANKRSSAAKTASGGFGLGSALLILYFSAQKQGT